MFGFSLVREVWICIVTIVQPEVGIYVFFPPCCGRWCAQLIIKKERSWSKHYTITEISLIFLRLLRFVYTMVSSLLLNIQILSIVISYLTDVTSFMQPTLIIWGEYDQIFPLELAHRLKRSTYKTRLAQELTTSFAFCLNLVWWCRHLSENAELVIIKDAGHAINMEKPKELSNSWNHSFLIRALILRMTVLAIATR